MCIYIIYRENDIAPVVCSVIAIFRRSEYLDICAFTMNVNRPLFILSRRYIADIRIGNKPSTFIH